MFKGQTGRREASVKVRRLSLALLAISAAGCDAARNADVAVHLQPLSSCIAAEAAIRQAAISEMEQRLAENLRQALTNTQRCLDYDDAMRAGNAPTAAATTTEGAKQTSTTNNQVAGVDEADFVKNDNKYIYVVSGTQLRILEAWPAKNTKVIGNAKIEGTPKKLFVTDNKIVVYSALEGKAATERGYRVYDSSECTYGYNCRFTGDGKPTKLTVFDISDRTKPTIIREVLLSGSLIAARRVGPAVHSVFTFPGVTFPNLRYWPTGVSQCGYSVSNKNPLMTRLLFALLRQENIKLINETDISDWLPSITDTTYNQGTPTTSRNLLAGCGGFYRSAANDGRQLTSVLSFDMTKQEPINSASIVSPPGAVYAAADALYMSVPREHANYVNAGPDGEPVRRYTSTVHKFLLENSMPAVQYAASGLVKGSVLNQFAMDQHKGFLRIATTSGRVPSPDVHSTMSVLRQVESNLDTVGIVDHLAPKEDIRSVRFSGDRGYVVTFKKTDPLFVFDLSHPFYPRVMAELKIPGFSTYMHMLDDTHLLTIGYDASDQGSFAWFTGVMLQIFDVSDPRDPKLTHKEVIGTRGSSSEALTNHLAFTFFAPKKLLALPMTVCEGGNGGGGYGTQMTFSGLMVYQVDTLAGFSLQGKVAHPGDPSCRTWWTRANSEVRRSIFMDDFVYSISSSRIKVNQLGYLSQDLADIPIGD